MTQSTNTAPTAPVKKSGSVVLRTAAAVLALAAVSTLATRGDALLADTATSQTTGTLVSVDAPAAQFVCPNPILPSEQDTAVEIEGVNSEKISATSRALTGLGGGAGSVSYTFLEALRTDEEVVGQAPQLADLPYATQASGTNQVVALPKISGALVSTTQGRLINDAQSAQYTTTAMYSAINSGAQRGLASASCAVPSAESWLVGGSTQVGAASTSLVIQNAAQTPATVKITAWGPSGRITLAGSDSLLVPAGAQIEKLLDSIAPEQRRIAVHVEAEGALITSYLKVNEQDGLTPGGIELVSGSAYPSRAQVIPVVSIPESDEQAESAIVRLVVPDFRTPIELGEQTEQDAAEVTTEVAGHATIYLLNDQGNVVMFGGEPVELLAGQVQDIDLTAAPAGIYSVLIDADVPVAAAVRSSSIGAADPNQPLIGEPRDFAWSGAQQVYSTQGLEGRADVEAWNHESTEVSPDISAQTMDNAIAVPQGLSATVVVTSVPNVSTAQELSDVLGRVPNVYVGAEQAPTTEQETDAEQTIREQWTATETATITVTNAAGEVIRTSKLSLAPGQSKTLDLNTLAQGGTIQVRSENGGTLTWGLATRYPDVLGAISVLQPQFTVQEPTDVWVARTAQTTR